MRISDWSSDVCSSDLDAGQALQARALVERTHEEVEQPGAHDAALAPGAEGAFGVDVETRAGQLLAALGVGLHQRSEERRVGKAWVSKCSTRWSLVYYTINIVDASLLSAYH